MGRRSDHTREELNEMIIAAAYDLIEREGYAGLSTRKIAANIGYTVGTLYNVFKNLDDIFLYVNARTMDKLLPLLEKAVVKGDPEASLRGLAQAYIDFSEANFNLWSMLFEYRFPETQKIPEWYSNKIDELYYVHNPVIKDLIPGISDEGIMTIKSVLWSGVHGACLLSIKGKLDRAGAQSAAALAQNLIDTYVKGLGK